MAKRIGYLGPRGTFTEQAALLYDPNAQLVSFTGIPAVAAAVATGMVEEGVVAIENSIEGSVTDTLDVLIHETNLSIKRELVLPINHYLLVKEGTKIEDIEILFSHPQALSQCRQFLERCFPQAQRVAALSTAAAVEEMLKSESPAAAIATQRAAQLYDVDILAQNIQDHSSNVTRFIVLATGDHPPTGQDKTSLCFSFAKNKPGILYRVLGEFAQRNINLAKVESRPSKEDLGQYIFLVDLEGHRSESIIGEALEKVQEQTAMLRIFGSYPKYESYKEK
ncbi:MAG: prephenate dehydratase [Dehalococcoidia bacterium]